MYLWQYKHRTGRGKWHSNWAVIHESTRKAALKKVRQIVRFNQGDEDDVQFKTISLKQKTSLDDLLTLSDQRRKRLRKKKTEPRDRQNKRTRRRKKPRTAAQKAATKHLIAYNKRYSRMLKRLKAGRAFEVPRRKKKSRRR